MIVLFLTIIKKSKLTVEEFIRKQEKLYKDEYRELSKSEDEWINILCANPKLIQRPIIVAEHKAVIAQPPERMEELF